MSNVNSTIRKNYRPSFFRSTACPHRFAQPKGMSYAAWRKQLKKLLREGIRKRCHLNANRKKRKTFINKLQRIMKKRQNNQQEQRIDIESVDTN